MTHDRSSPYLLDEPPTSVGKALLARAFSHWCALHHGFSPQEIATAFAAEEPVDAALRSQVGREARLIGELIAAGQLRTLARPFGGGDPEWILASLWELDDFRPRIANSALNLKLPFSPDAAPTHWIFVDLEDFNRLVKDSCSDIWPARTTSANNAASVDTVTRAIVPAPMEDRHVRMPELERRTGMSRSTIYRRIEAGRFPNRIPMEGNIASWWESDIAEWLANPR